MRLYLTIIFITISHCLDAMIKTLGGRKMMIPNGIGGSQSFKFGNQKALSTPFFSSNSLPMNQNKQHIQRVLRLNAIHLKNRAIEGEGDKKDLTDELTAFIKHKSNIVKENGEENANLNIMNEIDTKNNGKFVIRWAKPEDTDQIYKIYFGNNQSHLKPTGKEKQVFEDRAKKRIELDLKMGRRTRMLVVERVNESGIAAYLIFQEVHIHIYKEQQIIRIDDFFIPSYLQKDLGKEIFSILIKIVQAKKIKLIEWLVYPEMERIIKEELINLGEGVENENQHFSLWHLKNKKFVGHIYEKDENEKTGNFDLFEFEPQSIYAEINLFLENGQFFVKIDKIAGNFESEATKAKNVVKAKQKKENIVKAIFKCEPYFTWSEQYAWLEDFNLKVEPKLREKAMMTLFSELEKYFSDRKVQGIAWIADQEMMKKFEKIFESLHATKVMNVHRWVLKNV